MDPPRSKATLYVYNLALRRFYRWLLNHYPSALVDRTIPCPTVVYEAAAIKVVALETPLLMEYVTQRIHGTAFVSADERPKPIGAHLLEIEFAAIRYLFAVHDCDLPQDFTSQMRSLIALVKSQRSSFLHSRSAKRIALPFLGYDRLSFSLLTTKQPEFIWLHGYTVILWNLMFRSRHVSAITWSEIGAGNDHLSFALTNDWQDDIPGPGMSVFRLYANHKQPHICPLLALGIQLACYGCDADEKVFSGKNPSKRYGNGLQKFLARYGADILQSLDVVPEAISGDSIRKGAIEYVSMKPALGPSMAALTTRSEWKPGKLPPNLVNEENGDIYLGRLLTGLSPHANDFRSFPPRFHANVDVSADIETCFPTLSNPSPRTYAVLRLLLASMVFHCNWIKQNVDQNSPLLSKLPFSSPTMLSRLSASLLSPTCGDDLAQGSGTPATIAHPTPDVSEGTPGIRSMAGSITARIKAQLAEVGVDPSVVSSLSVENSVLEALGEEKLPEEPVVQPSPDPDPPTVVDMDNPPVLGSDWVLPQVGLSCGWELWWLGDPARRLPPFRLLPSQANIPDSQRKLFSEWNVVYRRLENILRLKNLVPAFVDERAVADMFIRLIPLLRQLCGNSQKTWELKVSTVAKKVRMQRKVLHVYAHRLVQ